MTLSTTNTLQYLNKYNEKTKELDESQHLSNLIIKLEIIQFSHIKVPPRPSPYNKGPNMGGCGRELLI